MKRPILFCLLLLLSTVTLAQKAVINNNYRLVAIHSGTAGNYSDNIQKTYIDLSVYLENNSDNTLIYCGTDCIYKQIFKISSNPYLYLENQNCEKQSFKKFIIPPHRSQKIQLLLSRKKELDDIVNLKVSMKLFRWVDGKPNNLNNKFLISIISDNVSIKYDKNHNPYWDKQDSETEYQKKKNMPADLNLHLLTSNERKLYTLTIDERNVTQPHDSLTYDKKRITTFNIPVLLNNNSNNSLKFLTMSCSWYQDFFIDNKYIHLNGWDCIKNIPDEITIPPHGSFLRILPVNVDPRQFEKNVKFKVSMSLTINDYSRYLFFDLYPQETGKFNQIWSNEIKVPQ